MAINLRFRADSYVTSLIYVQLVTMYLSTCRNRTLKLSNDAL